MEDKTGAKASRTLVISSYATWRPRTVKRKEAGVDIQDGELDPPADCVREKDSGKYAQYLTPKWENRLAMTMLEEC